MKAYFVTCLVFFNSTEVLSSINTGIVKLATLKHIHNFANFNLNFSESIHLFYSYKIYLKQNGYTLAKVKSSLLAK